MQHSVFRVLKNYPKLKWWLLVMCLVQIIFSYNAIGFFHPDQHFQIIEFASHYMGLPSGTSPIWELKAMIRPSFQVHLFTWYYQFCMLIGIVNPFIQLTIIQLITGLSMFVLFSSITIYYLSDYSYKIILTALILLNLSWSFPYIRSLFSSEILSAGIFFGAAFWYTFQYEYQRKNSYLVLILLGLLMGFAFYTRFQMGLAIAGWYLAILLQKQFKHLVWISIGLLVAIICNVYLDYLFYQKWVFTPFLYYQKNIAEGVANSFGTSSFLNYLGLLSGVVTAPLGSLVFFVLGVLSVCKNYRHPLVLSTLAFVVGHCFVGHKEERFLFPIFFIMPVIIAWQLPAFFNYLQKCAKWKRIGINFLLYMGYFLNTLLLILFVFIPYSQTVAFARSVNHYMGTNPSTIHCIQRTPLETESNLPLTFYQKGVTNLKFIKLNSADTLVALSTKPNFIAVTFNDIKEKKEIIEKHGYRPIKYSSALLWHINEWLFSKNANTINDIWVLYQLDTKSH